MTLARYLPVLLLALNLGGCSYHYGPKNNMDFNRGAALQDLEGFYENKMESRNDNLIYTLSRDIWQSSGALAPKDQIALSAKHQETEIINVNFYGNELVFEAVNDGCVITTKSFKVNERFDDGEFELDWSFRGYSAVHIGPDYQRDTIGVDVKGDVKVRNLHYAGGLAFWIIPFAFFDTYDYRVKRLGDKKSFPDCGEDKYFN